LKAWWCDLFSKEGLYIPICTSASSAASRFPPVAATLEELTRFRKVNPFVPPICAKAVRQRKKKPGRNMIFFMIQERKFTKILRQLMGKLENESRNFGIEKSAIH
jgi:hypothetical protein